MLGFKPENENINQNKTENIHVANEPCKLPSTLMDVTSWEKQL